jgi:hypothetical protein
MTRGIRAVNPGSGSPTVKFPIHINETVCILSTFQSAKGRPYTNSASYSKMLHMQINCRLNDFSDPN